MKKRFTIGHLLLAVAVVVLIAASPSFSNFDVSQFSATSAGGVSVKRSGSFTNETFVTFGGSAGMIARDYAGLGPIFSVIDQNAITQFFVDLDGSVNVNHSLNLAYGTATTLAKLDGSKNLVSMANASGVMVNNGSGPSWGNIWWPTNGVSAAATFPAATNGVYSLTNAAGAIAFTAVSGTDPANVSWGTLIIDANGSDRTLTLPASWRVPDGVRTITVTNGIIGVLSVNCYGQKYTNAFYRPLF